MLAGRRPAITSMSRTLPLICPPGSVGRCATLCCMARRNQRVRVHQLRQNLSVFLRRVKAGETLEVTDRGRAVAVLAPLAESATPLRRLTASGRATAAAGDVLKLGRPSAGPVSARVSEALQQLRNERL